MKFDYKALFLGIVFGLVIGFLGKGLVDKQALYLPEKTTQVSTSETTEAGLKIMVPLISNKNQLIAPQKQDTISSPVAVAGNLWVFENQFNVSVFDDQGKELGRAQGYAHSPDIGKPGPFVELVSFAEPKTKEGKIEIWSQSAKEGSKEVIFSIPIRFQ